MLNIKILIAASLLSGMAVASFAQAPATPAKAVPAITTAAAPAAAPTAAATDAGTAAKPEAKKVKHHAKAADAKTTTEAPAK